MEASKPEQCTCDLEEAQVVGSDGLPADENGRHLASQEIVCSVTRLWALCHFGRASRSSQIMAMCES